MVDNNSKYGVLLNQNIKLHRQYFREMCKLIGIKCIYKAPRSDKHYTEYTEIDGNYFQPIVTSCIFSEHPDQRTCKKMGWVSELQADESIIHVDYDLPQLQVGSLFILPSGIDNTNGRVFRVTQMSVGVIYPASIMCSIAPEYENTFEDNQLTHKHNNYNLLNNEEDPQ